MNFSYIATHDLYKQPDDEAFNREKDVYFQQSVFSHSENPAETWNQLSVVFQAMFHEILPDHVNKLITFMDKCKTTINNNENVLSLSQHIDYFKRFYFLYHNTSEVFQLKPAIKKKLLIAMTDFMAPNICNIGCIRRYESILDEYQSHRYWIDKELYTQREIKLQTLADHYNAVFNIKALMSIHTLDLIRIIAREKKLGFFQRQTLSDAHIEFEREQSVRNFFDQHYKKNFAEYEKTCLSELSQHVLLDMIEALRTQYVDLSSWDTSPVPMPQGYTLHYLHGTEEPSGESKHIYIKRWGETLACSINNKIFFLDYEKDADSPDFQASLIRIKNALQQKNFSATNHISTEDEQNLWILLSSQDALPEYAFMHTFLENLSKKIYYTQGDLRDQIMDIKHDAYVLKSKPECLRFISTQLYTVMTERGYILPLQAISDHDDEKVWSSLRPCGIDLADLRRCVTLLQEKSIQVFEEDALISIMAAYPALLFFDCEDDLELLIQLPWKLKMNVAFMHEVASFFYLMLDSPSYAEEVSKIDRLINLFSRIITDSCYKVSQIPEKWHNVSILRLIHAGRARKDAVISMLKEESNISFLRLYKFAEHVTYEEFDEILSARAQASLPPLPYCENSALYASFDRGPTLGEPETWFLKYMRYYESKYEHQSLIGRWIVSQLSEINIYLLFSLLCSMIVGLEYYVLLINYYSSDAIRKYVNRVYPHNNETYIYEQHWHGEYDDDHIVPVLSYTNATVQKFYDTLEEEAAFTCMMFIVSCVLLLLIFLPLSLYYGPNLLKIIHNALRNTLQSKIPHFLLSHDVSTQCETSIVRLRCFNAPSAHQKADVLDHILQKMKKKYAVVLYEHLNEKYTLPYQKRSYHISFLEVANTPRSNQEVFSISERSSWRLSRTTSSVLLAKSLFAEPVVGIRDSEITPLLEGPSMV